MAELKETLEGKVEMAILAQLADAGIEDLFGTGSISLFGGLEFEEQEGGNVFVACFGGPEVAHNTGNYLLRTRMTVRTSADREPNETTVEDPRTKHRHVVQAVREAIFCDGSAAALSEQEALLTVNFVLPGEQDTQVVGRYFETAIDFEVHAVRTT